MVPMAPSSTRMREERASSDAALRASRSLAKASLSCNSMEMRASSSVAAKRTSTKGTVAKRTSGGPNVGKRYPSGLFLLGVLVFDAECHFCLCWCGVNGAHESKCLRFHHSAKLFHLRLSERQDPFRTRIDLRLVSDRHIAIEHRFAFPINAEVNRFDYYGSAVSVGRKHSHLKRSAFRELRVQGDVKSKSGES